MDTTPRTVRLASTELEYLRSARFLPPTLLQILNAVTVGRHGATLRSVSRDVAEEFRSALTHRLATAGFDADYEPNVEGRMLEELIDRFHFQ